MNDTTDRDHRDDLGAEEQLVRHRFDRDVGPRRLDSERLDLLAATAVRQGGARRTRQRWATGTGAVLAGAAVFAGVWAMTPGDASHVPTASPGFASGAEGDGGPALATPLPDESFAPGSGEMPNLDPSSGGVSGGAPETAPVRPVGRGVTCAEPADQKMICQLPGDVGVVVTWREAASRGDYLSKGYPQGGKAGAPVTSVRMLGQRAPVTDEGTVVGPVKDGVFVTVQGAEGVSVAKLRQVAASLEWVMP